MIIDIFYFIIGAVLRLLISLFSVISYAIPIQIQNSITYFVGYLRYFQGVFPIDTLVLALITLSTVATILYGLKVALFFFAHIPWIGKGRQLPTVSDKTGKN